MFDMLTTSQLHDYHQRAAAAASRLSAQQIDMLSTYPALPGLAGPMQGGIWQHYQCLKAAAAEAHELSSAAFNELRRRDTEETINA
jgi:hypothetical protein